MATGISVAQANSLLDTLLAAHTWIKLHTGDPGAAGTANAAAETTRKQATWGSSSGGAASNTGALSWTSVAGTEDATHFTAWTASTAGSFGFSGLITANALVIGDNFTIAIGDLDVVLPVAS